MSESVTTNPEVLISIDCEFTGPIPGPYSMISFGAVAYTSEGCELSRFKINLHELPGSTRDEDTMNWWVKFPEAWEASTKDPVEPAHAMRMFASWVKDLPGAPKLFGHPLSVDFMFIYWYYVRFVGEMPLFGFNGIDVKTYAMACMRTNTFASVSKRGILEHVGITQTELSHDPAEDAAQQAQMFFALKKGNTPS